MGKKTRESSIAPVVTKTSLYARKNDAAYWRTQPPIDRLAALEQIRQEYHRGKYSKYSKIRKIVKIIKRQ